MLTLEIHLPLKNCKSASVVMRYCFCTIKIYCRVILALRSELCFGHFGATVRTHYITSAEVCWVQHVLGPEVSVSHYTPRTAPLLVRLKPNSITLASSELAPNMFEAGSCQIPLH